MFPSSWSEVPAAALLARGALVFVLLPVVIALVTSLAASARPLAELLRRPPPWSALRFGVDTFAFRNDSRIHHRGKRDLYANWCFVMSRAVVQFRRFARFDPAAPRATSMEYTQLVRQVTSRAPWRWPLPEAQQAVVPGFASLHELTQAEEAAVKAGLRGRFWSLVRLTNGRLVYPHPRSQQERVAAETVAELQAGRPVQWLISDFPRIALNHSVLVFDYRLEISGALDFIVYDPNDPSTPGTIRFDRTHRWFHPASLCGVTVPRFRVYRMYCSPLI